MSIREDAWPPERSLASQRATRFLTAAATLSQVYGREPLLMQCNGYGGEDNRVSQKRVKLTLDH